MNLLRWVFITVVLLMLAVGPKFVHSPVLTKILFVVLGYLLWPVSSWIREQLLIRLGLKQLKGFFLRVLHKDLEAIETETVETIEILKESVEKESSGHKILQSKVKIEFSDEISETEEKALREGEKVVIILNHAIRNRIKTFVKALWLYIQQEFLTTASRFFDKDLIFSMRYFIAVNILRQKGYRYMETFREYIELEQVKGSFPNSPEWLPKLKIFMKTAFLHNIVT